MGLPPGNFPRKSPGFCRNRLLWIEILFFGPPVLGNPPQNPPKSPLKPPLFFCRTIGRGKPGQSTHPSTASKHPINTRTQTHPFFISNLPGILFQIPVLIMQAGHCKGCDCGKVIGWFGCCTHTFSMLCAAGHLAICTVVRGLRAGGCRHGRLRRLGYWHRWLWLEQPCQLPQPLDQFGGEAHGITQHCFEEQP